MNYQKDFARGIKDLNFYHSFLDGTINKFLKIVVADNRFVIHIRNNYFNVYYKSGSIAKIGTSLLPEIDQNYFKYSELTKDILIKLFEEEQYEKYLNIMVDVMESYWDGLFYEKHPKTAIRPEDEGDVQQKISINNKKHNSDFDVLDLEYQVSTDRNNPLHYDGLSPYAVKVLNKKTGEYDTKPKSSPRFDIVAIKEGKLYVIELKKGTSALKGKSGMHDHIDSFIHTIAKNEDTIQLFIGEMKNLLKQKQEFGLIDKDLTIVSDSVEFCFAYSFRQLPEKRKREIKSINNILNYTDENGIKPGDYNIIYLEPGEYKLTF